MDLSWLLAFGSIIPFFPDPYHPEKYGLSARSVCFWEWIVKEFNEVYTGVELEAQLDKSGIPKINPPANWEDYSQMWVMDVAGKTVIDIGADRGSTAAHFLRWGASKVICVEGSEEMCVQLLENLPLLQYRVDPVNLLVTDGETMTQALSYPAEIVKIDIEGGEEHLLGVSPEIIRGHEAYMIEFHYTVDVDAIKRYLESCGFESKTVIFNTGWTEAARNGGWDITYFWRF